MLHKKSWQDIRLFLLVIVVIIATGVVLTTSIQRGKTSPSVETDRGAAQQTKTESATDKAELPQTETIAVEPSSVVTNAEKSLPGTAESSYQPACQKLKEMYAADHSARQAQEDRRYAEAQQAIINSYSAAGMSFSQKQKTAQSLESKRHDAAMKQFEAQFQKQLAGLRC